MEMVQVARRITIQRASESLGIVIICNEALSTELLHPIAAATIVSTLLRFFAACDNICGRDKAFGAAHLP